MKPSPRPLGGEEKAYSFREKLRNIVHGSDARLRQR
jgi:hypothetical protein